MTGRVLLPYDDSDQARFALQYAVESFDTAEIVLLHVIKPFGDRTGGGIDSSRYEQQLELAESRLDGARNEFDQAVQERIELDVRFGRPAHGILKYLDDSEFDHVVIGSHGRDGAVRILLGSVAETVARRSPAPVTVVRQSPGDATEPDHVLVPFDGSEYARHALEHALGRFEEATITALYITQLAREEESPTQLFDVLEDWEEERQKHVESTLEAARELAADFDRSIETEGTTGVPADTIVEYVEDNDIDQLVIGSRGRSGLSRLLLGSVAEVVVRRAPVSVTIAR